MNIRKSLLPAIGAFAPRCLIALGLFLPVSPFALDLRAEDIPDVDFLIVRLDYQTYDIKGFYEFSRPYHKSLPDEGYLREGDIFYRYVYPVDLGFLSVKSRLTGELLVDASCVYMGQGTFDYPSDSLFNIGYEEGFVNPSPDSLIFIRLAYTSAQYADSAWSRVQDTDMISRLSSLGPYEVVLFDFFYEQGAYNPNTAEWIVIAFTHPPAPDDLALVSVEWPKTLVTEDIYFVPEIVVHNFSDRALAAKATLSVTSGSDPSEEYDVILDPLPADSSRTLYFDAVMIEDTGPAGMTFGLVKTDGSPLLDAYPDNDGMQRIMDVTGLPVFRLRGSVSSPGPVPLNGTALDFDGDGDIDIVQFGSPTFLLWQNDGFGSFTDITGLSGISYSTYYSASDVVTEDLNGDGLTDLLVVTSGKVPGYFLGDGTGVFTDAIGSSGLSGLTVSNGVDAFDKENDGDRDLIFKYTGQELIFENNGSGYFTDVTVSSGLMDDSQTEHIALGDISGDGYMDIVLSNWNDPSRVFINNGSGHFFELSGPWVFEHARSALILDYDADGLADILFARALYGEPSLLYRNLGSLSFVEVSAAWGGMPVAFSAAAADVDEDGSLDILLAELDEWALMMYDGDDYVDHTELLVDYGVDLSGHYSTNLQFVDIDGDGDLDIYSKEIYLENQGHFGTPTDDEHASVPAACLLHQNYPNPFNPSTTIRFDLPVASHVNLSVYNVKGEMVAVLADRPMSEGRKEVLWNATDERGTAVASGVYFYRLMAGDFVQTRKMILLR